jgi:serine/threonine-protein kinase
MLAAVLAPGEILAGKYRIDRVLGKGGMGYVLHAVHTQLDQPVAIKFLSPDLCEKREAVARFLREARAAVRIQSEHVARVIDVGTLDDGAPFMVMEYLEGHDLAAELEFRDRLLVSAAIDYVLQACEALAEAHANGIVHRDLKPANLFLTRRADGSAFIKVLDFGISKALVGEGDALAPPAASLTATQGLIGSPHYMSPEQVRKPKDVDARTDIWSLGIILHELLTGLPPFMSDTPMSVLAAVVSDPPPSVREVRPEVSEGLQAVIFKCLEKDVSRRYQSVAELAEALRPHAPAHCAASISRIIGVIRAAKPRYSTPSGGDLLPNDNDDVPTLLAANGAASRTPHRTSTEWGNSGLIESRARSRRRVAIALAALVTVPVLVFGAFLLRRAPSTPVVEPAASSAPASAEAPVPSQPPSVVLPAAPVPAVASAAPPDAGLAPAAGGSVRSSVAPPVVSKPRKPAPAKIERRTQPAATVDPLDGRR